MTRVGLFMIVLGLAGCGYTPMQSDYHWNSLYRPDVHTVAVPIFQSTDYHRGVEFQLTKAVVNQMELHSPYKVVPRERADTILEGEIVSVKVTTLSSDTRSALPQEQLMDVTINFVWKDLRNGRILCERRGFEQTASYFPTLGEGQFTGTQDASERLALAIVQELQTDW